MTPQEFIRKWKPVALTERATAQEHFLDLCRLFDHPTPAEDDPAGERFTFEKGVLKTGGGDGFADVWKKDFFAWEYKKKKRDLDKAFEQLTYYAAGLENPPLHVACDTHIFRIETRWTSEVPTKYEFELDDLGDPKNLDILHNVFWSPDKLRSGKTRAKVTREAADKFQTISDRLQHRNPDREVVAHFVNQLVFCFFADSVGLLPNGVWKKLLERAGQKPDRAQGWFDQLFRDMREGGDFNLEDIAPFNGGLFDERKPLRLDYDEIGLLFAAASLDWGLIDPTIFGTLFERFLDPDKRAQIGAHYTDPEKIMLIVEPVVMRPLLREWEHARSELEAIMAPVNAASGATGPAASRERGKKFDAAVKKAEARRDAFIDRLCGLRILDPACGSGNFLYLALQAVKDLEWKAILHCETLGLGMIVPRVAPEILHGIEINPFAAELARTTIWIGDIQWRVRNGVRQHPRPVMRKLDSIECRDALLTPDGKGGFVEAQWPAADYIVGNPPFLGGKLLRRGLGDANVEALFRVYAGRVPAEADLVCYWFAKAWEIVDAVADRVRREAPRSPAIATSETTRSTPASIGVRVGLVATNSIRGGANRKVLEPIAAAGAIFEAWSDEAWTVDGAAVRVSLVCFDNVKRAQKKPHPKEPAPAGVSKDEGGAMGDPAKFPPPFETRPSGAPQGEGSSGVRLDSAPVDRIHADLSAEISNLPTARQLPENEGVAFMGDTKGGAFDVAGDLARAWLVEPLNANGAPNSAILSPWINGLDLTRRPRDMWIVDFGWTMSEREAALYEAPFAHILEKVKPERDANRRAAYRERWWRHVEPRPAMWAALNDLGSRHGRVRPGHPRRSDEPDGVDARHKAGHDGAGFHNRFLVTPRVAKHRVFQWMPISVVPDSRVFAFARDDECFFGILQSTLHGEWSLRTGSWHGVGNDPVYTPTTTFETFPFPEGLTPNIPAASYAADPRAQRIAAAARRLDELRRAWLNPPDLVDIVPEVTPTAAPGEAPRRYPDRTLPKTTEAAAKLKERTLTNLYNQRPRWLSDAHDALDRAVATAYGWPEDIATEEALARLLALNLARAATQSGAAP